MFDKIDISFLLGAFLSFVASILLWFLVSHDYGLFVGLWVPSVLGLWIGVRVRLGEHLIRRKVISSTREVA